LSVCGPREVREAGVSGIAFADLRVSLALALGIVLPSRQIAAWRLLRQRMRRQAMARR